MKVKIRILFYISIIVNSVVVSHVEANDQSRVCEACHGVNGNSSDPNVPNLAGQKMAYLSVQLKAFKSKQRKNPLMNAVAANLSEDEITSLAAFFSTQATKEAPNNSTVSALLQQNQLAFPTDFPSNYQLYTTVNRSDNKQVRSLYIDKVASETFKKNGSLPYGTTIVMEIFKAKLNQQGDPVFGKDGYYVKDALAAYATMENTPGWGDKIPAEIRNADWKYAFFKASKEHHPTRNMAKCMACHKPLSDQSFMFSFEKLDR